ncbi:MAG: hypothetical protein QM214_06270 [Bacillota bacterium]|jgi:hypothetical protein|nr:hypothetical protein [Bacillota bacterium]
MSNYAWARTNDIPALTPLGSLFDTKCQTDEVNEHMEDGKNLAEVGQYEHNGQ